MNSYFLYHKFISQEIKDFIKSHDLPLSYRIVFAENVSYISLMTPDNRHQEYKILWNEVISIRETLDTIIKHAYETLCIKKENKNMFTDIDLAMIKYLLNDDYVTRKMYENTVKETPRTSTLPAMKKVYFNDPATVILWADGTKTVVKCSENDIYDPEKGLAIAITKKALGNKGNYYETIKKWLPEEETDDFDMRSYMDVNYTFQKALGDIKKKAEDFLSKV